MVSESVSRANWDRIFGREVTLVVYDEYYTACDQCCEEVTGVRAGDEALDYCEWCEEIVEGGTHTCYGRDSCNRRNTDVK